MKKTKPNLSKRFLTGSCVSLIASTISARLPFRRTALVSPLCVALAFLALSVAARAAEPGPEADGEYSCGNSGATYVDVTKLELKGRTYREFKEGETPEKRGKFLPFTVDDKGRIRWSARFSFLTHVGNIQSSIYSAYQGPKIVINYSDHKRNPVLMICTQDSSKESPKDNPKASPKEK